MTTPHDELLELCAGYVLGALDDAERSRLETHLEGGCAECEAALRDLSAGVSVLAAASPAVTPRAEMRKRVLDAVAKAAGEERGGAGATAVEPARGTPPERAKVVPFPMAATIGWLAAAACALGWFVQQRAVGRLGEELDAVRGAQARLEQQLVDERQWAASMASPAAKVAFLAATPDGAADLKGWALYDPSTRRAIVVLENLELEPGHDYELWGLGARVQSLGVIEVDAGGRAMVRLPEVEDPADIKSFAVSKEVLGGSPNPQAPSGPVVMFGDLSI
ncbi:MAG: anti-sigma factor [Candidatus Eiseniibacteriota bacterium]